MCEVVEISDDEDFPECCASQTSTVEECSQSCRTALASTSSDVNSVPEELCPADRKKAEREAKRKEKEERKALREQLRIERRQEKAREKAIKEILKATDQENKPGERVKNMLVYLDNCLSQKTEMMKKLLAEFDQLSIDHSMESSKVPNLVRWHRKLTDRNINDDATIMTSTLLQEEQQLLVVMDAEQLAQLVVNTRTTQQNGGVMCSNGQVTCRQFVKNIQRGNESKRITLAIVGLEAFERSQKTKQHKNFRKAVLTQASLQSADDNDRIDKNDLEESLVELELSTGCCVRKCQDDDKLVELIIQTTKAIADAPFKRKNVFSFHDDLGPGPSKKDCIAQNKLSLIWQHQLLQFLNTGPQTVAAITSHYPTPCDLIKAYQACESEDAAALLLQDIMVVRSTSRRLGPVLSKKVHRFLTSTDGTTMLD